MIIIFTVCVATSVNSIYTNVFVATVTDFKYNLNFVSVVFFFAIMVNAVLGMFFDVLFSTYILCCTTKPSVTTLYFKNVGGRTYTNCRCLFTFSSITMPANSIRHTL